MGPWLTLLLAFEPGHVQVQVAPGTEVVVAGQTIIADDDGALLRNLPPGPLRLELRKKDHATVGAALWLNEGDVAFLHPSPLVPSVTDATATVLVQTFPANATVELRTLRWPKQAKGPGPWVGFVTPGKHRFTFCSASKCIDHRITLKANQVTALFLDFEAVTLRDVTAKEQARWRLWGERCQTGANDACLALCHLELQLNLDGPGCGRLFAPTLTPVSRTLDTP